jgi:pimeloyl-ACP methyl ester carboxylesterase
MTERRAIVFLHGTRLTAAQWTPQVSALSDEFDCLAIDLPGHGARREQPFTLASASESVADAIATQAGGRAVLVGQSL